MVCDTSLESSWRGLQIFSKPYLNPRSTCKVIGPQSHRSSGTKSRLDVGPMGSHIVCYKGEGDGFPQVRAVVSLVNSNCPWLILALKVLELCIYHLVLVLCKPVWISEACQFCLVPSWNSSTPFYPSKMLRGRECASTSCSFIVFCLGLTFESLKELGAHKFKPYKHKINSKQFNN